MTTRHDGDGHRTDRRSARSRRHQQRRVVPYAEPNPSPPATTSIDATPRHATTQQPDYSPMTSSSDDPLFFAERGVAQSNSASLGVAQHTSNNLPAIREPMPLELQGRPALEATAVFRQGMPAPVYTSEVTDQLEEGLAERTAPAVFQILSDWHVWPLVVVWPNTALGWGVQATEPLHPWIAGGFFAASGVAAAVPAIVYIRHGDENSDPKILGTFAGAAGTFATLATAMGAGFSFVSVMVSGVATAVTFRLWFGWRRAKLEAQRGFLIDYEEARTPKSIHITGGAQPQGLPPGPGGGLASHEELLVRRAFEGMHIDLSDLHSFERLDNSNFRITAALAPGRGVSPESVISRKDVLRNALGANQVLVQRTRRGHEVRLTIRYGDIDPHAETINFPGITVRTIKEPIPLGPAVTGEMSLLSLDGNQTVVGGTTNNGKSGLVNVIATSVVGMEDALLVLIDRKPGRPELGIYEPVAYAFAEDTLESAALVLEALVWVIKVRGAKLKRLREASGKPVRKWDTKADGPALVLMLDEMAELFRGLKNVNIREVKNKVLKRALANMVNNLLTILQVGRAYEVVGVIATQKPSSLASGGVKDGIDQCQNRISVGTTSPRLTNIILGEGKHGDGFRATELDAAGKFLMVSLAESVPVERKAYWVSDEQIAEIVEEYADNRPELDEDSDRVFQAIMAMLEPQMTGPTGPDGGPDGSGFDDDDDEPGVNLGSFDVTSLGRRLRVVQSTYYPNGTEVLAEHVPLWELLAKFGPAGADTKQLAAAAQTARHTNYSLSWVRNVLSVWREAGSVVCEREGQGWRYWRQDALEPQVQDRVEAKEGA
jgi:hypothetical protein